MYTCVRVMIFINTNFVGAIKNLELLCSASYDFLEIFSLLVYQKRAQKRFSVAHSFKFITTTQKNVAAATFWELILNFFEIKSILKPGAMLHCFNIKCVTIFCVTKKSPAPCFIFL